jgi:hypothetical protein
MQLRVIPFQPTCSFIFPPHELHFISVIISQTDRNYTGKPEIGVTPQLRITAKKDSGQAGMTRSGFANFSVIDPKIPLTLTLSPKGRGGSSPLLRGVKGCVAPPLRGGDKREGDVFMFLCEPKAHVDSRRCNASGILPRARYQPVTESLQIGGIASLQKCFCCLQLCYHFYYEITRRREGMGDDGISRSLGHRQDRICPV